MSKENLFILVASLAGGGQERQAVQTASVLMDTYHVRIITFTKERQVYSSPCELINLNLPPRGKSRLWVVIQQLKRSYHMYLLRKKYNPSAVISFGSSANLCNALSSGGGKCIVSIRGYNNMRRTLLNSFVNRRADQIICVSKELKLKVSMIYPKHLNKTMVLYNGLDLVKVKKLALENVAISCPGKFQIIVVGRLIGLKGFHQLLRAFSLLLDRRLEATLTILGEGELEASLKDLANKIGIAKSVHFLGFKQNPYKYMRESDLFVMSSIHEGFPNVLIEAMACGLPVISTDCLSGPVEILHSERESFTGVKEARYGLLVPAFTHDQSDEPEKIKYLSDAIEMMMKNKNMYMHYKRQSQIRAKDFSLDEYSKNIHNILRN